MFVPTSTSSLTSLPRTECAIRAATQQASSGVTILSRSQSDNLWLRDANGWRWEWFLSGLTPRTNYTAYALQDGQLAASKPVMFVTKSGTCSVSGSSESKTYSKRSRISLSGAYIHC